ncbi:MAG: hypothetical protein OXL96_12435 [Candidatus Poribacteria bacterium]|nr:hypothetical protein [Candidatus Poribacteria bacterium]
MADERVKMRLWRGLTTSERHARYYSHRAKQQHRKGTAVSIIVLVASSSSVVALVTSVLPEATAMLSATALPSPGMKFLTSMLPEVISAFLVAVAGIVTIVDMKKNFSREATNALWIKNECRDLVNRWERLWLDRDNPRVMELAGQLEDRLEYVTREEIDVNDKLNERFAEEAFDVIRGRLTPEEPRKHREKRAWWDRRRAVA